MDDPWGTPWTSADHSLSSSQPAAAAAAASSPFGTGLASLSPTADGAPDNALSFPATPWADDNDADFGDWATATPVDETSKIPAPWDGPSTIPPTSLQPDATKDRDTTVSPGGNPHEPPAFTHTRDLSTDSDAFATYIDPWKADSTAESAFEDGKGSLWAASPVGDPSHTEKQDTHNDTHNGEPMPATSVLERNEETPSPKEEHKAKEDKTGDIEKQKLDTADTRRDSVDLHTAEKSDDEKLPSMALDETPVSHEPPTAETKEPANIPDKPSTSKSGAFETDEATDPTLTLDVSDHIIWDSFTNVSERRTWYRISRQESSRRYNAGADENYRPITWAASTVRMETLKIVRRWMEEDSLAGRPTLGGTGVKGNLFGWDSAAAPVALDEVYRRRPKSASTRVPAGPRRNHHLGRVTGHGPSLSDFGAARGGGHGPTLSDFGSAHGGNHGPALSDFGTGKSHGHKLSDFGPGTAGHAPSLSTFGSGDSHALSLSSFGSGANHAPSPKIGKARAGHSRGPSLSDFGAAAGHAPSISDFGSPTAVTTSTAFSLPKPEQPPAETHTSLPRKSMGSFVSHKANGSLSSTDSALPSVASPGLPSMASPALPSPDSPALPSITSPIRQPVLQPSQPAVISTAQDDASEDDDWGEMVSPTTDGRPDESSVVNTPDRLSFSSRPLSTPGGGASFDLPRTADTRRNTIESKEKGSSGLGISSPTEDDAGLEILASPTDKPLRIDPPIPGLTMDKPTDPTAPAGRVIGIPLTSPTTEPTTVMPMQPPDVSVQDILRGLPDLAYMAR